MITSLYASLLGFFFVFLTFKVIGARRKHQISLGTGKNFEIQGIVSLHNNFTNYVGIFLVLFYLVETSVFYPKTLLYIIGALFILGRILHYSAYSTEKTNNFRFRVLGMQLTLFPIMFLSLLCFISFVAPTFGYHV